MDNSVLYNLRSRRKNSPKSALIRPKNIKLLTGSSSGYSVTEQALRKDFANIELELENENLRKMIKLLEGKTKVLEEHCGLLREKNLFFETRLRSLQNDKEISDKDADEDSDENTDEKNQKMTSLKDRISGVVFGIALPKLGEILSKIREKRHEIKNFIKENGDIDDHSGHCPLGNPDFKAKLEAVKVNLFRVAIVLGTLILVGGVGYGGYKIWKTRYRHPSYLLSEDEDDDSAEELFSAPNTSRSTEKIIKNNSTDSFETPGISTDFRSILDVANNK